MYNAKYLRFILYKHEILHRNFLCHAFKSVTLEENGKIELFSTFLVIAYYRNVGFLQQSFQCWIDYQFCKRSSNNVPCSGLCDHWTKIFKFQI
jgi:hypothetical protein